MNNRQYQNSRGSNRLLLVDDDPVFCQVLGRALTRRGYQVDVAHSVSAAMDLAQALAPDRAIVDLRLEEESGLELVRRLGEALPDTRVLVLTGYASIATAVEAIKLGAVHYLTKPADAEQIIAAFARIGGNSAVEPAATPLSTRRLEWEHLQKVLMEHDGNISATARALGMHRRTLQRKLNKRPVRS